MVHTPPVGPSPGVDLQPSIDGPALFREQVARLQRKQTMYLVCLEQSYASLYRKAWDRWIRRFAGGAQIDP